MTGDVWVSTDKGLFHSTNNGTSFTTISGVAQVCRSSPKFLRTLTLPSVGVVDLSRRTRQIRRLSRHLRRRRHKRCWLLQVRRRRHKLGEDQRCHSRFRLSLRERRRWRPTHLRPVSYFSRPHVYVRTLTRLVLCSVYIGTNGRGIFFGDTAGAAPPATASAPASSAPVSSAAPSSAPVTSAAPTSAPATSSIPVSSATIKPPAPGETQTAYGQCGGNGWTGPTVCVCEYASRLGCAFVLMYFSLAQLGSLVQPRMHVSVFSAMSFHQQLTPSYLDYSQCIPN